MLYVIKILVCYVITYSKICSKLHRTGQGWVPKGSVSKLKAFIFCTRIKDAMGIFFFPYPRLQQHPLPLCLLTQLFFQPSMMLIGAARFYCSPLFWTREHKGMHALCLNECFSACNTENKRLLQLRLLILRPYSILNLPHFSVI